VLAVFFVLGPLFGFLGYREARNFESTYGEPPWKLSPICWGLIVFFGGLLVGGLLLMIARRRTKASLEKAPAFAYRPAVPAQATFAPASADPSNPYAAPATAGQRPSGMHPGSMNILPGA
jgi:hypothetical protein